MSAQTLSALRCIACDDVVETRTYRFRCPSCGDLLQVEHDLDQLRGRFEDLKARFNERLTHMRGPYASGIWRYHELILPDLPLKDIVSQPEGSTGLYQREAISRFVGVSEALIKHEGENPTLSFKDRGMTAGVSWAKHVGAKRLACASTGDTSAALACYAATAGLQSIILLPHEKISIEQLAQPISYGSRVLALETDFDGCMALVKQLTDEGDIYLLNSMNPFRIEGQKSIGIETLHQLDWQPPDWFVIPVGNAGNISALGKGLSELHQLGLIDRVPRIAGVQAVAADPLYRSYAEGFKQRHRMTAQPTIASAIRIGDPVSFDKAKAVLQKLDGVMTEVTDAEAMDAKAVTDAAGVNICPNSGVAVAGAQRLRREGVIGANDKVVIIATAHGSKFASTSLPYHDRENPGQHANPPRVIGASMDAIREAIQ